MSHSIQVSIKVPVTPRPPSQPLQLIPDSQGVIPTVRMMEQPHAQKLPKIPKGATVRRRPVPIKTPSTGAARRIYITAKTPFRSVTARVRKQLDKNLRAASASNSGAFTSRLAGNKRASLDERIRAIQQNQQRSSRAGSGAAAAANSGSGIGLENTGEVVVLGTGRAIQRVAEVALFFQKQNDCVVRLSTSSVAALDDVFAQGEEEGEEEWGGGGEERMRMMSCLEASIRLR
ncbi:hypothetical protein AAE478_006659 [Parahypoxylon ruwenzoriense]